MTELGLRKISQPTCIKGFQQAETPAIKYRVDFTLRVPTGTVTILKPMRALVVENITGDLPSGLLPAVRRQRYLQGLQLAEPSFDMPGRVDMSTHFHLSWEIPSVIPMIDSSGPPRWPMGGSFQELASRSN